MASSFDIPVHEMVDALISDLAYAQVTFIRSEHDNRSSANEKVYVYKYRKSAMQLAVGDLVAVTKRLSFDDVRVIPDGLLRVPPAPPMFTMVAPALPPMVQPGIAIVVNPAFDYDYDDAVEGKENYIAWLAGKIDLTEVSMCIEEERKLRQNLRASAKGLRKRQVIQQLLGDSLNSLQSPLITKQL